MTEETYKEKILEIEEKLTAENRQYFDAFYEKILAKGAIKYKEKAMLETVYNLLLDLLDAQVGRQKARVYFGVSSDELAENMLKKMPKSSPAEIRGILYYVAGSALFWQFFGNINWFSNQPVAISWVEYLVGGLVYVLAAYIFFTVVIKNIAGKSTMMTYLIGGGFFIFIIGTFVVTQLLFGHIQVFYINAWLAKLIGIILAIGYGLWTYSFSKDK